MEVLAVISLVALFAIVASAMGHVLGPLVLGLGYLGLAALFLLSGYRSPGPEIGFSYLVGCVGELGAAGAFWSRRKDPRGPAVEWRVAATLLGLAGVLLFVAFLIILAAAIGSFYSQL